MGSLLNEIHAEAAPTRAKCPVLGLLETLDEELKADLLIALSHSDIPSTGIARALNKRGIELHERSIQRHRKGVCPCPRT